ncbi:type II secretion system protein [Campylobacter sp.]|uniref:type II secretion system protein n=1 Tax=Campylobacter sp. TaxID=205 RepID=UPI0039C37668
MIELIFVIVILGILASVAIPRLAGTRTDAEVATAVANLRTIASEVGGYYVAHGSFGTVKWQDLTNVSLANAGNAAVGTGASPTATAQLKVGGANCIGLYLVEKNTATKAPAHIKFTTVTTDGVCGQVLTADPVEAIINNTISYTNGAASTDISNAIAIGSTTSVY